ncbi:MAG: hypothetical protein ACNA7J_02795 [Wenzhouxiangella sp.]
MGTCATCGNDYDGSLLIRSNGQEFEFDSFECAIEKLAPRCEQCDVRVIGHGVQRESTIYCGAHCASQAGETDLVDRN